MKFKIHTDFRGAQDGMNVTQFKAGEIVEISDHLAPHIGEWATPVDDEEDTTEVAATEAQAPVEHARHQGKGKRDSR